ncbi:hypothetical protein BABINDRAFT_163508 [Babjeviella inositovora NRRL Y-12698]|uniref:Acetyl-coenzyme A synthetase n=1 Tax=Babjeviella inositovora NRRL Y-12698 TaxID=984486 RepID=A0A1E3QIH5_9ASCO|nr:uncharacterized protein BABINDRAFT_163508 [Babjeviella inositovora NRRL Y-12698]ODQ77499.1 hypothetical protein BABINDRAFT_163508 [Babjeviella inositovora NRRL Y-12698]
MPDSTSIHTLELLPVPAGYFERHPTGKPHVPTLEAYERMHKESIENPARFFGNWANKLLQWDVPFDSARLPELPVNDFKNGEIPSWFVGGKLNACYNAVDRHAMKTPDKVAIIWEPDNVNEAGKKITYGELLAQVCRFSQVLVKCGVKRGDTVAVYLPMIPEALVALLAIVRIGAVHSVVFAGFSSVSLGERINDSNSKLVITADAFSRGGRIVHTKAIVDEALQQAPQVAHVVVVERIGQTDSPITMVPGRDLYWHEETAKYNPYYPITSMNASDPLFLLYTSGSTGKPKGIQHLTAGYLLGVALALTCTFDFQPKTDVMFCAADIGWVMGHTFVMYAPLVLGGTTVVYEGTPNYPDCSRYWDIIDRHQVTHFSTAPTALRLLKLAGPSFIDGYKLSSLRILSCAGEPIAPEIWHWFNDTVGRGKCHLLDTYWATEAGSHLVVPFAGVTPTKAGSAGKGFFGIDLAVLDPRTGKEITELPARGALCIRSAWPLMTTGIYQDYARFKKTYLEDYPGFYVTGDGVYRDVDGYYWVLGRTDDVVNVSGHRLSTAEIESVLIQQDLVADTAVVGFPDELTGQAVAAYVVLRDVERLLNENAVKSELVQAIRKEIGPFAAPKLFLFVEELPKTRSGKLMRRILRKVLVGEEDQLGDISTLANENSVKGIIKAVKGRRSTGSKL